MYRLELKRKTCCYHTHFRTHPFCFSTHPHTHHLVLPLLICLHQAWLISDGHNFDILEICIKWRITQDFAMYSGGHSSPIINCMFSKCGIWEHGHVGNSEKETKDFVHCHTCFLTRPHLVLPLLIYMLQV